MASESTATGKQDPPQPLPHASPKDARRPRPPKARETASGTPDSRRGAARRGSGQAGGFTGQEAPVSAKRSPRSSPASHPYFHRFLSVGSGCHLGHGPASLRAASLDGGPHARFRIISMLWSSLTFGWEVGVQPCGRRRPQAAATLSSSHNPQCLQLWFCPPMC